MVFIIQLEWRPNHIWSKGWQLLDRKSSSWDALKVWMEWWPSLKLTVPHRTNDPTWPFFWGVETIVPSTQRVILPAFLSLNLIFLCKLHRLPMWAGPWNWGSSVFLEFHPTKPIGIIFTPRSVLGRRLIHLNLGHHGFWGPGSVGCVAYALASIFGTYARAITSARSTRGDSAGWGLGSLWVEWRNTSFSTWAHAKYI